MCWKKEVELLFLLRLDALSAKERNERWIKESWKRRWRRKTSKRERKKLEEAELVRRLQHFPSEVPG